MILQETKETRFQVGHSIFTKMKTILLPVVLLSVFANNVRSQCFDNFAQHTNLQENSAWCWAAGIQMVLDYYGTYMDQCEIVEDFYEIPACESPATSNYPARSMFAVQQYLTSRSFESFNLEAYYLHSPMSGQSVITELNNCRPVMAEIQLSPFSGTTHLILIIGYYVNAFNQMTLTIVDPYPYSWNEVFTGGIKVVDYTWLVQTWRTTICGIRSY